MATAAGGGESGVSEETRRAEREHFESVIRAFLYYREHGLDVIKKAEVCGSSPHPSCYASCHFLLLLLHRCCCFATAAVAAAATVAVAFTCSHRKFVLGTPCVLPVDLAVQGFVNISSRHRRKRVDVMHLLDMWMVSFFLTATRRTKQIECR